MMVKWVLENDLWANEEGNFKNLKAKRNRVVIVA